MFFIFLFFLSPCLFFPFLFFNSYSSSIISFTTIVCSINPFDRGRKGSDGLHLVF